MTNWTMRSLGDLTVNLDRRRVPVKGSARKPGPYAYYGASGIVDWVDGYLFEGLHLLIAEDGENLRSRKTPIAFLADGKFWVNNHAHILVANESNDIRFLAYAMQATDIAGYITGSAQPKLNQAALSSIKIDTPSLPTQRRIAATLGALDDKIESNRRAISLASRLIDTTAEQATNDLSTTPLSTLVATSKVGSNPAKLDIDAVDHYSLPAFDTAALPERVAPETIMSNKTLVPHRAILLSRLNPRIERFWWVTPENGVPALASTEFSTLVNETDIGLAAAWLALRSPGFREVLPMRVTGTSGSHQRVRPEDLLAIDVPDTRKLVKPLLEQTLSLLEYIEMARRQSAKLAALRDALLPELLSGRIRVPVECAV